MTTEREGLRMSELWKGSSRIRAYAPIFWQHLTEDTSTTGKIGLAAVAVVVNAIVSSVTVLAVIAFGFFCLDFASGVLRAVRQRNRLRLDRAGDGFVKLGLYFIMWQTGVLMDLVALETVEFDTRQSFAAVGLGYIIWMEVTSIADNMVSAFPRARGYFARILTVFSGKGGDP